MLAVALLVGVPAIGGYIVLPYLQERQISASSPTLPSSPPGDPGVGSGTIDPVPEPSIDIAPVAPTAGADVIVAPSDIDVSVPAEDGNAAVSEEVANTYGPPAGVDGTRTADGGPVLRATG